MATRSDWYLVSSHGAVLFFIAANPSCTVEDIAGSLHVTRRTIWGVVGDLRGAGMLNVRKDGRRHRYTVNLDAPFLHPVLNGVSLRTILGALVEEASGA